MVIRAFLDIHWLPLFSINKFSKAECKAVLKARRDFKKMKDKFKDKRQKDITSYPSQVYKKSIVITSKLNHKTSFLDIENKLQ
jgi:hypothetical protein